MTINWQFITEGYNDKYHTPYTEKQMWKKLYPKYSSQKIEEILGVSAMVVLARLRQQGINIQPKGQRHPTKLDKFKAIPRNVRGMLSVKEIAHNIGTVEGTVMYYRVRYGG